MQRLSVTRKALRKIHQLQQQRLLGEQSYSLNTLIPQTTQSGHIRRPPSALLQGRLDFSRLRLRKALL